MSKISFDEMKEWPASWAGFPSDIACGKRLIEIMWPFVEELTSAGYAKKTIKRHYDNLWVLGGFIIEKINYDKKLAKTEPAFLLSRYIDSMDGPLIHDFTETEQRIFDSTCKKFYKYLVENVLRNYLDNLSFE